MSDVLDRLAELLEQRKSADPASSYVAKLYAKGMDSILKKIGEEATETVIAAKGGNKDEIIYETADLWFHTLIMLAKADIKPQEILDELARREGLSGIVEKESRVTHKKANAKKETIATGVYVTGDELLKLFAKRRVAGSNINKNSSVRKNTKQPLEAGLSRTNKIKISSLKE